MRKVKSSNVSAIDYDSKALTVEFTNGNKYLYEGVSQEEYNALCGADDDPDVSFGSYFHKNVKSRYSGKKLEAEN